MPIPPGGKYGLYGVFAIIAVGVSVQLGPIAVLGLMGLLASAC